MPKVNSILKSDTKYFKFRDPEGDKWFCGKTDGKTIPKGSFPITMFQYFEMAYGKEVLLKAMKELQKIHGVTGKGTIEIATDEDISHLPDANNPAFNQIIADNNQTIN
jgi:hypothetical protein